MNYIFKKSAISFGALGAALITVVLTVIFSVSGVIHAGNGQPLQNGHLITIHDRGVQKVIVTQSDTIGDALKEAKVKINPKDLVEPLTDQKLVASEYQVNIYRARPVIVVDGNSRTKIVTAYQTAEQIAAEAGIKLFAEDKAALSRVEDIISEGAGLKLTITRAVPFSFTLYGKTIETRTLAKTVGDLLSEKGIKLSSNDQVSPTTKTPISQGMTVRLWREGKQTISVDEPIAFGTDVIENADQPVSYREIQTAGEQGSRSVSYEITVVDGVEVARKEIVSVVTKQPKKQVEVVGVMGQYTNPSENENIVWNYLINHGFSRVQTAGIMGNLMQEHHFQTSGDGLAQWTGGRRDNLYSRPYPNNIYTQLDFLMEELNGSYASVRDNIRSTDSLAYATQIFQNQFERCGICMEGQRIAYAQNILASH